MVYKGEIIVARDPDLEDMYVCEVVRGDEENIRNILCRVISMVHYPIQHAILDGSVPNENPPLAAGTLARLRFVRRETISGGLQSWETSFKKCLKEYRGRRETLYDQGLITPPALRRFDMPHEEEFAILDRHERGEFTGRRAVLAQ